MKKLIPLIALLSLFCVAPAAHAQAAPPKATASVSFTPGGTSSGLVEHFVEMKGGTAAAPTWTEVAKAQTSPISWQIDNPMPGATITARVRARLVAVPSVVSEPSNEASGVIPPFRPGDAKISVSILLTITN